MAPHSSGLAWKIPWSEEPDGLQSMGSQRLDMTEHKSFTRFTFNDGCKTLTIHTFSFYLIFSCGIIDI